MTTLHRNTQVRESAADNPAPRVLLAQRLPRWTQGAITQLTGLPLAGQSIPRRTQWGRIVQAFSLFLLGIGGSIAAASVSGWGMALLPLTWGTALTGARDLQLNIMHQAAHHNLVSRGCSAIIGPLVSTLLLETAFAEYAEQHCRHHKHRVLSSEMDDTVLFLRRFLEIEPGLPSQVNRQRFLKNLVSPRAWADLLKNRLNSQFSGNWKARSGIIGYLGGMSLFAAATGYWQGLLLGWVIPLGVLYPIAKFLRAIVEHRWPPADSAGGSRGTDEVAALSFAIRCAVPPPPVWTVSSVLRWTMTMAFNVAIRVWVLPGESGFGHAWHHDQPKSDWASPIPAMARWEAGRRAKGLPPVDEVWGYSAALDLALESFAQASPASLTVPATAGRHP